MQVGWMTLGEGLPLDPAANFADELINNARTLAYAQTGGAGWLLDCHDCDAANDTSLIGTTYVDPVTDPAPWYNPDRPETGGFFGVYGVEISGAVDGTRTATVTPALVGGGVVGPLYAGPREMILRALAVADSDAALQEGMEWFKARTAAMHEPCLGDRLTYFFGCPPLTCRESEPDPCPCDDMTTPGGPCWANTYGELRDGPTECTPTWWPSTYGELKAGPPTDDEWCHWVYQYYELRIGADAWTCGAEACLVPYLWQLYNVSITEGPSVLSQPKMTTGAMMELEMTIVAADPQPHRIQYHDV